MIKLILLLTAVLMPESESAVPGSICMTDAAATTPPVCVATLGNTITVSDRTTAASYVWRRANGADIALGTIPPATTTLVWPARSSAVRIRDGGNTAWTEDVTIDVTTKGGHWQLTLAAREARTLRRLALAEENATVTASAAHRQPARIDLMPARLSYELVLVPISTWNGRVVDKKTRKGVAGVMVTALPHEVSVASTDYAGNFRFEVPTEWPSALRFSAGKFGTKTIPAPPARVDTTLPWVELTSAGAIALEVEREEDIDIDIDLWEMTTDDDGVHVASQPLRRGDTVRRFEDLDEGEYEVRLRGAGTFERYSARVTVREGEVSTERIVLDPVALDISVVREKKGVPYATLVITHMGSRWETDAVTDLTGHARGALWQQGLLLARVSQPGTGGTLMTRRSITGTNAVEWLIDLIGGSVTGTAVDSVEHFPVAQAKVYLETKGTGGTQQLLARTDEKGDFEFAFVPEGEQSITLQAVGYALAQQTFQLQPGSPPRRIRFELVPVETIAVRVVNSYGMPLVGATMTDGLTATAEQWVTNAEGRVSVPLKRGEAKTVFVLPREGSIAVATLSSDPGPDGLKEQLISVPKGEATIDIRTQDSSGGAVPDVELLLRYNGVIIPQVVTRLMLRLHGNVLRTGSAGGTQLRNLPLAYYEFWPYFSLAQFQQLMRGPLEPGTALGATPGNNSVILTFERTK